MISEIDNGEYLSTKVYNDVPVSTFTQVSMDVSQTSSDDIIELEVNGQIQEVRASATLEGDQIYDLVPPKTEVVASGTTGNEGWFLSDVEIRLDATDDSSGVLETRYSLDNGNTYQTYVYPLKFLAEGVRQILYYSVDKAGNDEEIKTYLIKIDKTPPEIAIRFNMDSKDFVFSATDNESVDVAISCDNKSCEAKDSAGNATILKFTKSKAVLWYLLNLDSVSYNGVRASLKDNLFWVKYMDKKDFLKDFNQTIVIRNQEMVRIDYKRNKDESKIINLMGIKDKQKYSLPGIYYIEVLTDKGKLSININ